MRKKFNISVEIPEEVNCEFDIESNLLKCNKGNTTLERKISILRTEIKVSDRKIVFNCEKANKKNIAMIKTNVSHVKNMFKGFDEKFKYILEICNVHFPMNAKVEGNNLVISNFLGEKINRNAKILNGVEVEVKGKNVIISGSDLEKTGQTAANIEKATKVPKKDRRIFQDGIFIVEKPGVKI